MRLTPLAFLVTPFILFGLAPAVLAQTSPSGQTAAPTPLVSPDKQGTQSMQSAAETPLRDANLVRQEIPPILDRAMADPYARPASQACRTLAGDVRALDAALGPDFDEGGNVNSGVKAATVAKVAAGMIVPFSGAIRLVTGASAHDRLVAQAILAGNARRSYLKGLGEARGCAAPAAPRGHAAPVHNKAR